MKTIIMENDVTNGEIISALHEDEGIRYVCPGCHNIQHQGFECEKCEYMCLDEME